MSPRFNLRLSSWEQALAAFNRKESSIDGTQESIIDSSEGTPEEELDSEGQYVDGEAMEGRQPGEWHRFLGPSEICRASCASKKLCKALWDIRQHIGDLTPTSSRIALSTWDDTLDSPTRRSNDAVFPDSEPAGEHPCEQTEGEKGSGNPMQGLSWWPLSLWRRRFWMKT